MNTHHVKLFIVLFNFGLPVVSGTYQFGSVFCNKKSCTYKDGVTDSSATAVGSYNDTLLETGWGILDIVSGWGKKKYTDEDIMYGAGYLEGLLTAKRLFQHYQNLKDMLRNRSPETIKKLQDFYKAQNSWTRSMIADNAGTNPMWNHVGLITSQFDGLVDGYGSVAPITEKLDVFAFQYLNGVGDNIDLMNALSPETIPNWRKMSHSKAKLLVQRRGMCSALIKVLGAYEEIFMSHSSWFDYQATMRIYKHYNFNVQGPGTAAKQLSFSSYPGFLESLDDFYLLGSNMVMLQTTNNVFNSSLYRSVKPQSLLAWQRVRVANMMANSGKEWASILAQYNSGTYNNQYMILDMKKVQLGKTILDDALWVVEQIPTRVTSGDQTKILRTGYWPSYNVPFYEDIFNMSGYPEFIDKHGLDFSYQLAPRAKIFRRDEGKVVDMETMKHLMRYNDYQRDRYSEDNSCDTICCRGDLLPEGAGAFGCYDTKVTNIKMAQNFVADIVNGPTLGSGLTPFKWSNKYNVSHEGLPLEYNFSFLTTAPRWNISTNHH